MKNSREMNLFCWKRNIYIIKRIGYTQQVLKIMRNELIITNGGGYLGSTKEKKSMVMFNDLITKL